MSDTAKQNLGLAQLRQAISDILLEQVTPITEFDLIRRLQQEPAPLLSEQALRGSLNLFQTHFLVFHCLYQLRDEWRSERIGELRIEPLAIVCEPWQEGQASIQQADPLRSYYLDWSQFDETGVDDVEALLDGFWRDFAKPVQRVGADERSEAMLVLDLATMPVTTKQLKRHYRQLVHQYHPDKGGDAAQMQQVQWAFQTLRQAIEHGVS